MGDERGREGGEGREAGEFAELIRYTGLGYLASLAAGAALDRFGLQASGIGQWLVRTLAGEGESLFEGIYALRRRLRGGPGSLAEAYGWGKLLGMAFPWAVDGLSRALGVDVYGVGAFYIPFFYALSDQVGANVSGLVFLRRQARGWRPALARYRRSPVMVSSLAVILIVPLGLLAARLLGFVPHSQLLTALETILANLCWLPPLVGWIGERRGR